MRLLIATQAVDQNNPTLGFFHEWIIALAARVDHIEVITLTLGVHALPDNVRVHSLGKEHGAQHSFVYAWRFLRLAYVLRHSYDAVFVHMNQEYLLIAGWLWKILSTPIYMWRNHYSGSLLTDIAALFCTNVFYTSKYSYTAKYSHAVPMPVGVDTQRFHPDANVTRSPHSILFLGRLSPSKRAELLIEALTLLKSRGFEFTATFVGSPLPKEAMYAEELRAHTKDIATFIPGVSHTEAARLFKSHQIYVNTSPSGMLDKTIFEAAACDCIVLSASEDVKALLGNDVAFSDVEELALALEKALSYTSVEREAVLHVEREMVERNSLSVLAQALSQHFS